MSEERFDRLEVKVSALQTDVQELKVDVRQLKTDVAELKTDVGQIKGIITELRDGQLSLSRQMRVLHEDVIRNIKAIPDPRAAMREEIRSAFAELREELERRIGPLETTVRQHSIDIALLKEGRT